MSARAIAFGLVCLTLPALSAAQDARLHLPAFEHLQAQATDSVDITLSKLPLSIAGWLMDEDDAESAELKRIVSGLSAVYIRSYEFASDFMYSNADVDAVRMQLSAPGWSQLLQIRDRRNNSDVDIYISMDGDRANGLAIVASEPRQFTILNIVGSIDLDQLGKLEGHLGLPRLGVGRTAQAL